MTRPAGPAALALALWLLALAGSAWVVARHTTVVTDLSALLSASADRTQRLLVAQLRDGVASRLVLIGIEGGAPEELADTSRKLVERLKAGGFFGYVNNGDAQWSAAERDLLMRHRYLLSPAVAPERFTAEGLRAALGASLRNLGSSAGALTKSLLPADPTGEFLRVVSGLAGEGGPQRRHGVWFSADGTRAQLMAETVAPGYDLDRQEQALAFLRDAFEASAPPAGSRLVVSSPGAFAVEARAVIERDSWRLSLIAGLLVTAILWLAYRSAGLVLLSLLPVLSGLLVGVAAVSLVFGFVHGITLGFGATLIGEAVDYPAYLFTHVGPGERPAETLRRIGPTLRLAVLTTVCGGLAMLLSSFTGLAQLGLLTMTGVLVAGLVTRWVLPGLVPTRWTQGKRQALPGDWTRLLRASRPAAAAVACLLLASAVVIATAARGGRLWDHDLANLSPLSESAKALDKQMRAELGAPDVRYLAAVEARSREEALQRSEAVAPMLDELVAAEAIAGYDMASRYLPSEATQRRRLAALPDAGQLEQALREASRGLPFRPGLFKPFLEDVSRAKATGPIDAAAFRGSALAIKLDTLLYPVEGRGGDPGQGSWMALAPLRGVEDEAALAAAIDRRGDPGVFLLDLKADTERLVNGYRREALRLTALGLAAIVGLLLWGLRRPVAVWHVVAPVLAAVVLDVAWLVLLGIRLSLFHLVSLLLVVGIGLNYALFFNRAKADPADHDRTVLALTVCSLATLTAFGALAWSATPVLHAIGVTVSLGALVSLVVSAVLARPSPAGTAAAG